MKTAETHNEQRRHRKGLIHHSDRGSQYVSIKYTERLLEADIEHSVCSVGDSYDNALADDQWTLQDLSHLLPLVMAVIRRGRTGNSHMVDWFKNRSLFEPIGYIPPAEAEQSYYAMLDIPTMAA